MECELAESRTKTSFKSPKLTEYTWILNSAHGCVKTMTRQVIKYEQKGESRKLKNKET